jgi:hypothetical protein
VTVSSTTNKHSYNGNGSQAAFAYTFKVFADADIKVYVGTALQSLNTHYTLSGVGSSSGGNVTFTSGNLPASGTGNVTLLRSLALTQGVDLINYGKFDAEVVEAQYDKLTMMVQQLQEQADRTIRFSTTVSDAGGVEITDTVAQRSGKVLAYDANGDLSVANELGDWQGDWSTASVYAVRDLVLDAATNNVYTCLVGHTAGTLASDVTASKWALVINASAVAASATAAANSATAAASSATTATTQASTATTKASEASTSASNASTSETNAASSASTASTKASQASTSETNAASSETNAASSASSASSSASTATTQASTATTKASQASISATNSASSATASASSASTATTQASTATTQASNAASSASSASGSASTATTQASTATTQASTATTKASEASVSAAAALVSKLAAASSANDINVAAIDASISDTAVDVFVYDTSKDSDGGQWRKRTQHTSWYNETLNTSTRGSRKEFPAVAVIVAESNQVTIYDGDDPDLPMWMVFNAGSLVYGTVTSGLAILNGIMFFTGNVSCSEVNFLTEHMGLHQQNSISQIKPSWVEGIVNRNSTAGSWSTLGAGSGSVIKVGGLVNQATNDIAITVLPNAPIDPSTNLPIPTIAVATDGGVSVIKDDGSVVDITFGGGSYNIAATISFTANNWVAIGQGDTRSCKTFPIPTADKSYSFWSHNEGIHSYYRSSNYGVNYGTQAFLQISGATPKVIGGRAIGTNDGLTAIASEPYPAPPQYDNGSLLSYITSDYSTGYMVGDIKLACLSDTDDTDVTGSELVTNGTFDSDTSGWSVQGSATLSVVSGNLQIAASSSYGGAYQGFNVVSGKTYTISVNEVSGNGVLYVSSQNAWNGNLGEAILSPSTTLTVTATSTYMRVDITAAGISTVQVDNISVRLADSDRSVNGNGLAVHGTITKEPVATGAELVAYSGFSSSNYLEQPYNSDLDFGTGDFSVMGWVNVPESSAHQMIIDKVSAADGNNRFFFAINPSEQLYLYTKGSSTAKTVQGGDISVDTWHQVVMVRNSTHLKGYIDGVEAVSLTGSAEDVTNTSAFNRVGANQVGNDTFSGSLALWRISATAPTAEQIAKIYEDEKPLFQENAKATLYGSSDAVTALAHDDSTNLLHVGTSSGRSVFSGLRRVDNTTDAVGSCISASNNLVVEE